MQFLIVGEEYIILQIIETKLKLHFFYEHNLPKEQSLPFVPKDGIDHWVVTTYYHLRAQLPHFSCTIGSEIPEEGVIFFHKRSFPKNILPAKKQFFVCFQVDYGRHKNAHWHIVHNPYQSSFFYFPKVFIDQLFSFSKTKYVNPWPQSGLIKRSTKRTRIIETISYHGNLNNLCEEIKTAEFQKFLDGLNLKLLLKGDAYTWSDFSDTDLVLTIRSWDHKPYYSKPYLKISNALLADVPVVGGCDSSSRYFNRKFINIPLVGNIDQLKQLLIKINNQTYDPFLQLEKFQQFSREFSVAGIIDSWVILLNQIETDFEKWKSSSDFNKKSFLKIRSILN